jgi:hypothetical protein
MNDQWTETLRCPKCRKTGRASLTHADLDATPTVNSVSDDFKVVITLYGLSFRCRDCDIAVDP